MSEQPKRQNRLLRSLPDDVRRKLAVDLEAVELKSGDRIIEPGEEIPHVYFPVSALLSIMAELEHGGSAECVMIGFEGMAGLPVFLGAERSDLLCSTQMKGTALRMSSKRFRKHLQDVRMRAVIGRYANSFISVMGLSVVCQAFHPLEQRLARWLLTAQDRVETSELHFTQEFLATMLGVSRPSVTISARLLQAAGLISQRYGKVRVLDRDGLEEAACECYRLASQRLPTGGLTA